MRRGLETIPDTLPTARRFDHVAPRYDLCNRLLSGGRDKAWRARLLAALGAPGRGRVLDVGCGTGDVALALRAQGADVVGLDPSRGMLARARAKEPAIAWVQGDATRMPFKERSFDASTSAFVLRNLPSRAACFGEQARVLRPGGMAAHLELVRPPRGWQRLVHGAYVRFVVPTLGLLSSDPGSYRYLARTVLAVAPPEQFARELEQQGLSDAQVERMALGGIAVVAATKP